jgi:hypothetical protein
MESEQYRINLGPILQSYDLFAKYIFEYVYGAYCLNSVLGVVHTDLHLNNATVYNKRFLWNSETKAYTFPNPRILYQVGGKLYLFPHYGSYSCIIDFSRALLDREHLETNFPPEDVPHIIDDQKRRILKTYMRDLPDFHHDFHKQLEQTLIINYDCVHRLVEAIDVYKISTGWLYLIKELLGNPKRLALYGDRKMLEKQAVPLLQKLQHSSLQYLTVRMQELFKDPIHTTLAQIPHPNLRILEEAFAGHVLSATNNVKDTMLLDYHCAENPITYHTNQGYEHFPPTVRLDYVEKHRVPGEVEAVSRWHHYEEYLESHPTEEAIASVVEQALEERAERRDLPDGLRSSSDAKSSTAKQARQAAVAAIKESNSDFYYDS